MALEWYGFKDGEPRAVGQMESPLGPCTVVAGPDGLISLDWAGPEDEVAVAGSDAVGTDFVEVPPVAADADGAGVERAKQIVEDALQQLAEYFSGARQHFDLPLSPQTGTDFQRAVWNYLLEIPYGETRSYGDVARAIGRDKAVRAVGQANRANPIPIVVPCHRVIGSNGALTGYAGSQVHLKAALLDLERLHDSHD